MKYTEEIFRIIEMIANEPRTKQKEEILLTHNETPFLKEVLYLAISPRIKFYKKLFNDDAYITTTNLKSEATINEVLDVLDKIHKREVVGGAVDTLLNELFVRCSENTITLIKRIILKDLRMGMGKTITNKVFKGLIETTGYQGAVPYKKSLVMALLESEGSVYGQIKEDGCYSNAIIRGGEVEFVSRQGEDQKLGDNNIKKQLSNLPDCVLNGELIIKGISDRATANGIIASIIDINLKKDVRTEKETQKKIDKFVEKNKMSVEEMSDRIAYKAWDVLTIMEYFNKSSKRPYDERLRDLSIELLSSGISEENVAIVETKEFTNFEDIISYYNSVTAKGLEGVIVKSKIAPWKNGKPNWAIKIKHEIHLDLKIVGYRYGTGKNAELISSINVESSDGKLVTYASGLTDEDMLDYTENQDEYLGRIVEVKCCGLSTDKYGNYSLAHPSYIEKRFDKDEANSLDECLEIYASATK